MTTCPLCHGRGTYTVPAEQVYGAPVRAGAELAYNTPNGLWIPPPQPGGARVAVQCACQAFELGRAEHEAAPAASASS